MTRTLVTVALCCCDLALLSYLGDLSWSTLRVVLPALAERLG